MAVVGALSLFACSGPEPSLKVTDATYRPPLGGGSVGVAYLTIESRTADRILEVSSPAARSIEIHTTVLDGAMASMEPILMVELPARTPVLFTPGGRHLMVIDPEVIETGEKFPITIRLESGGTLTIECATDQPPGAGG